MSFKKLSPYSLTPGNPGNLLEICYRVGFVETPLLNEL